MAGKAIKITRNIVMNSKAFKEYEPEELRPGMSILLIMKLSQKRLVNMPTQYFIQ